LRWGTLHPIRLRYGNVGEAQMFGFMGKQIFPTDPVQREISFSLRLQPRS
jgi:hypothetical protein